MIPLLIIEGATASGKSSLALVLAEALQTEIISADSRQVYRLLDIGTAKVSQAELARVPHHLIDIIDPDQTFNAGLFVKAAENVIDRLSEQNKLSIVCGGTGLYIKALLEGIFEHGQLDPEIRDELRSRLRDEGAGELYLQLEKVDPLFASKISPSDSQRILRGLEIYLATGKTLSQHWSEQKRGSKYHTFRILIDLPRTELYARIDRRVRQMLDSGLIEEIRKVLGLGYSGSSPGLKTLGYKEFMPYLEGQDSLEECGSLTAQHTRNYAKRQVTWYRKCDFDLTITSPGISISSVIDRVHAKLGDRFDLRGTNASYSQGFRS